MSVESSVKLVGRDPEFRHVRAAMERVRAGVAAVTVIEGEPGIGKTRLMTEAVAAARSEGWHVVAFRCSELDADRPFEAVASGLEELCNELGPATPFELGEAVQALRHKEDDKSVHGDQVTTLVLEGLAELCRIAPCVVLFDDAHWIDDASAQVLWGLARRHHNTPMFVLSTFRPSSEPRVLALRRGLDGQGAATLALSPLSASDGEAIARSMLGVAPNDEVRRLLRDANGNPLFIIELVGGLRELGESIDSTDRRVPASLRGLVERRLGALPVDARAALSDAALLGLEFDLEDLGVICGVGIRDALALLAPAIESRVLVSVADGLAFRHGVVQTIVAESQPEVLRRHRHREIAELLGAAGRSPTRVAEHFWLSLARQGPEPKDRRVASRQAPEERRSTSERSHPRSDPTIADWMGRAALEVRALSLESALTWLERGRVCVPPSGRFLVDMDIATVLLLLNRSAEAEIVCRDLEIHPVGADERVRLNEVLAAIASMSGPSRGGEAAEHLMTIAASFPSTDHRRIEPLGWRSVLSVLAGRIDEGRAIATESLSIPFDDGSEHLRSQALEGLALIEILQGDMVLAQRYGAEAVAVYRDRPDRFSTLMMTTPHFTYALSMLATESIGSIMGVLHDGFQVCDRAGHLLARLHLEPLMATAHFVRGDIVHAKAVITRTLERNSYARTGVALPTATALAAYIAMLHDDLDEAKKLADVALAELLGGGAQAGTAEFAVWCIAGVAEEAGDVDRARELLVTVWELVARDAGLYSITPDLVRLTKHTQPDFAADVAARCSARAARSPTPLDRGHAHATRGWLNDDWSELTRAVDAWAELDWSFSGARTLQLGLPLAPVEDRASVFSHIREQWQRMDAPRMLRLLDASDTQLAQKSSRARRTTSGPMSLSQAELAVVRLVGEGLTNKEIAERLFVSHRTVDSHVSHALSKLGVNGRVALAGLVVKGMV